VGIFPPSVEKEMSGADDPSAVEIEAVLEGPIEAET
jgi:hypothetical protein